MNEMTTTGRISHNPAPSPALKSSARSCGRSCQHPGPRRPACSRSGERPRDDQGRAPAGSRLSARSLCWRVSEARVGAKTLSGRWPAGRLSKPVTGNWTSKNRQQTPDRLPARAGAYRAPEGQRGSTCRPAAEEAARKEAEAAAAAATSEEDKAWKPRGNGRKRTRKPMKRTGQPQLLSPHRRRFMATMADHPPCARSGKAVTNITAIRWAAGAYLAPSLDKAIRGFIRDGG